MAIKAADQISIIDITDSYTIELTTTSYTCLCDTSYALAQTCDTTVSAYQGSDSILVTIGDCVCPEGVTASIANNGTATPKITFTIAANKLNKPCEVTIPITVGDGVEFTKKFSIGVALKGAKGEKGDNITISSQSVKYQAGSSGTSAPTGTWSDDVVSVSNGQFLWTRTVVTYSDGTSTTSYSVSYKGTNGTSVSVSSQSVTYQTSSSGTTAPTGEWKTTIPTVTKGQYLWTKTYVKYSDGKETTAYSVSYNGTNGTDGKDAITISITSSAGFIFKNASIATTLTAHVYQAGKELTSSTTPTLASVGTIKWYKDGGTTAVATGPTLTITAGDVANKATYTAQLEG